MPPPLPQSECSFITLDERFQNDRRAGWEELRAKVQLQTMHYSNQQLSLARCTSAEDLIEAREVWTRTPSAQRHRVAKHIFSANAALVESSIRSGTLDPALDVELGAIRGIPLTEERGGAGHAVTHRERRRAPNTGHSRVAWFARLRENLEWSLSMTEDERAMIGLEWMRAKRALQVRKAVRLRPKRGT